MVLLCSFTVAGAEDVCGFWAGGWHRLHVQGKELVVVPNLVTGCKIWHLREKGTFYPKTAWANTVASLPDGASVCVH